MIFKKAIATLSSLGVLTTITAVSFAQTPAAEKPGTAPQQDKPALPAAAPAAAAATPSAASDTPAQPTESVAPAQEAAPAPTPVIAPAAPVAAAPRPPVTEVAPVETVSEPKKDKAETTLPSKLGFGDIGWLQIGVLMQGWYDLKWNSSIPENASRKTASTFRMRRAEIKVSGDLLGGAASYLISFDPAATYKYGSKDYTVATGKTDASGKALTQTVTTFAPPGNTAALKLFWVQLKSPYVDAAIGQFKYPISYEGQSSSAELLFPERAYSTRYFGDTYDMGVRLEKKFDFFKYQVFLLNGSGQNQIDTNLQKDLSVRLEVTPIEGVTVGTSGLTSLAQRTTQPTTRDIIEGFGRFNKYDVLVQGELIWGKVGSTSSNAERTKAAGRYVMLGYTIAKRLQPVFRLGYLNTDKTVNPADRNSYALYAPFSQQSDEVRSYEFGLNYYLKGNNLKLQAAYGYFDFDNVPTLQEFTVSAQASL
jgi:hypothetical protein